MNSRVLVIILCLGSVIILAIHYCVTKENSLWLSFEASILAFLAGLPLVYLIIEKRIDEEKRARQRPVEQATLNGVSTHAIAVIRAIGMYASQNDLEIKPSEDNQEMVKRTESFAKKVLKEGLQLPQSNFDRAASIAFIKLLDDLLKGLFSLQARYSFVIEKYPDVATLLNNLEAKQSSIKSAIYWALFAGKPTDSERTTFVEKALVDIIRICDELAETTSKYLQPS